MKKKILFIIVFTLIIVISTILYHINFLEMCYINIKTTDLKRENINKIYIDQNYNEDVVCKTFGKVTKHNIEKDVVNYLYEGTDKAVNLKVQNNKIVAIDAQDYNKDSIRTGKGITFGSSLEDIVKSYGDNYKRVTYSNIMGSGNGYDITYIDKVNRLKLEFEFIQTDNIDKLNFIGLSKY